MYTSSHTSGHWTLRKGKMAVTRSWSVLSTNTAIQSRWQHRNVWKRLLSEWQWHQTHKLCEYCHFRELECQLRNLGYPPQRPAIRPSSPFGPLQPAPKSPIFWSYRYSVNTANHAHYMPEDQTMKTKTCLQQHAPLPCHEFRLVHGSSIENLRKHRILCLDYQIRGAGYGIISPGRCLFLEMFLYFHTCCTLYIIELLERIYMEYAFSKTINSGRQWTNIANSLT